MTLWIVGMVVFILGGLFIIANAASDRATERNTTVGVRARYDYYDREKYFASEADKLLAIRASEKWMFWGGLTVLLSPVWFVAAPTAILVMTIVTGIRLLKKEEVVGND